MSFVHVLRVMQCGQGQVKHYQAVKHVDSSLGCLSWYHHHVNVTALSLGQLYCDLPCLWSGGIYHLVKIQFLKIFFGDMDYKWHWQNYYIFVFLSVTYVCVKISLATGVPLYFKLIRSNSSLCFGTCSFRQHCQM